jgi:hypothetical protein
MGLRLGLEPCRLKLCTCVPQDQVMHRVYFSKERTETILTDTFAGDKPSQHVEIYGSVDL